MKSKVWLVGWFALVMFLLSVIGGWVYKIDPYFHYHKPDLEAYFYVLNNQRSQNDGISKHFDYDALITGTSMTANFKTSEMDAIFGVNSIKVPYSGGSYKETNDNLAVALENNPNLKIIVRGLDYGMIFDDKDRMRDDLGSYPTYLYDKNPFNDVRYMFNKDIIFGKVYAMALENDEEGFIPGITSFDDYSRWQYSYVFGKNTVIPNEIIERGESAEVTHLIDVEKDIIKGNITQNVTSLADEYPDVDFYYFFSPYSAAWWSELVNDGTIYRQIEAEQYVVELILEHDNIHLYSFNNRTDITTNLNNYKDAYHYGEWINSLILRWMHDGEYLLTKDNYLDYLAKELSFYMNFNYESLNWQEDYESDFYAAALLNYEFKGAEPIDVLNNDFVSIELSNSEIVQDQHNGKNGIQCIESLQKEHGSDVSIWDYVLHIKYVGAKICISELGDHNYLVFYGKKVTGQGQPAVYVYSDQNEKVEEVTAMYQNTDNEWHQYVINLSKVDGGVTLIFNGGDVDNTGSLDSTYVFSDITLY